MFSTTSANSLPSAPSVWMTTASTPAMGPRPKAITNRSAKTSSGTVRHSSQKRRATRRTQRPGATLAAARKASAGGRQRPQERADIGHQQGLAEQPQPALQAPEPFAEIRPDGLAVLEVEQAEDVAREPVDVLDELERRDLGRDRGQHHRGRDARGEEQRAAAAAAHRGVVGRHAAASTAPRAAGRLSSSTGWTGSRSRQARSALLLAQRVDELDQLDDRLVGWRRRPW